MRTYDMILETQDSELTQQQWCEKEDVKNSALRYWRHKLCEEKSQEMLEIPAGIPPTYLSTLLQVMRPHVIDPASGIVHITDSS